MQGNCHCSEGAWWQAMQLESLGQLYMALSGDVQHNRKALPSIRSTALLKTFSIHVQTWLPPAISTALSRGACTHAQRNEAGRLLLHSWSTWSTSSRLKSSRMPAPLQASMHHCCRSTAQPAHPPQCWCANCPQATGCLAQHPPAAAVAAAGAILASRGPSLHSSASLPAPLPCTQTWAVILGLLGCNGEPGGRNDEESQVGRRGTWGWAGSPPGPGAGVPMRRCTCA